ncbi:TetR/AcrR family transcriptional regulator [Niallia circulans]|uniref:TetR/AcrR family transcriptional regulator n=1 Tax=Niallia circulans TaxID=1397 RepID=A0A941JM10_NIACI|nr:TetR/AcrR family transcriptional regulator [Niallia circulans]MCB5236408.1 TetR/AcrR family transcriptional regulator [Niallia circulans]
MNSNQKNNSQNITKDKLIKKVFPYIRKYGFQSMKMEEIAKYMDVSKATMYKYFASKEEIMESTVDALIKYIDELVVESDGTIQSFTVGFQQLFEQSVLLAAYIPDDFFNELQAVYPMLYNRLSDAMRQRENRTLMFYQQGNHKGFFNKFNENLIFLQVNVTIRALLDIKYLMTYRMTLTQGLWDYYHMNKYQLFKVDYLQSIDDSNMTAKIDYMESKITRDLL